jgi:anti-sigma factor RsiW
MNCQSCSEALTALLDDELAADEQKTVLSHLSECPDCKQEFESLRWAFSLTEQAHSIRFEPSLWSRVESELTTEKTGFGSFFETLFLPRWRPIAAAAGVILIALVIFVSFPSTEVDPSLEREFTQFIQEREEISRENRRILFERRSNRNHREGNPFVRPVSYERTNPFQE